MTGLSRGGRGVGLTTVTQCEKLFISVKCKPFFNSRSVFFQDSYDPEIAPNHPRSLFTRFRADSCTRRSIWQFYFYQPNGLDIEAQYAITTSRVERGPI